MNKIKERLKEIRIEKKYTQKEVASLLNTSITCYAGYEQGYREPNADMIIKICYLFNISADYLLGMEEIDGRRIENKTYNITFK